MIKYYSDIIDLENSMRLLVKQQDGAGLKTLQLQVNDMVRELDEWFNKYIELFDHVLNDPDVHRTDPVKRLYNYKYDLYVRLRHVLDRIRYHLHV